MFYKKKGLPEEGEYVLCTIKKILYHSVFANLDEYDQKDGMIHISEVSPGRIRNLRDYVKEGKKVICKVLRIKKDRGHIDLSLRRVSTAMRKKKNAEIKQEQRAEKIMEILARQIKVDKVILYKEFGNKIWEEYESLYNFFQEVVVEDTPIEDFVPTKYTKQLNEILQENIKPKTLDIERVLELQSESPNGVELIKETLKKVEDLIKDKGYDIKISYISAPNYKIKITSQDYKSAEKAMDDVISKAIKFIESKDGHGKVKK